MIARPVRPGASGARPLAVTFLLLPCLCLFLLTGGVFLEAWGSARWRRGRFRADEPLLRRSILFRKRPSRYRADADATGRPP